MEAYQIKNNYRYLIYKNGDTGEHYLIDSFEYWWITILFPFLVWHLPYKAYSLTEEECSKFKIKKRTEVSSFGVAGVSMMMSPMIVEWMDNSLHIPNIINNAELFHMLILIGLVILCPIICLKCNTLNFDFKHEYLYIKIRPKSIVRFLLGHLMYFMFLMFPGMVFTLPYIGDQNCLLNLLFLLFSMLCIFIYIEISYFYMENNGPYTYKFKEMTDESTSN